MVDIPLVVHAVVAIEALYSALVSVVDIVDRGLKCLDLFVIVVSYSLLEAILRVEAAPDFIGLGLNQCKPVR